jgi:hypothetical protein
MRGMKHHAPATERNREPIAAVLAEVMPADGLVLEISSGTGQHAAFFANRFPGVIWQPSDPDPESRLSIEGWCAGIRNVLAPLDLDVTRRPWPVKNADLVVCINMIHIAPWEACEALMEGAAEVLPPGGVLFTYGPYKRGGKHTAPSNESFDQGLRARDPAWGVRDLDDVARVAARRGLALERFVEMPANNLSVIFRNA